MTQIESLESLASQYAVLTGQKHIVSEKLRELLAALSAGYDNLIVELPWHEIQGGKPTETHQILVHTIQNKQVLISNPYKQGQETPGEILMGPDSGPVRTVQADGHQSLPLETFKKLFEQGGRFLKPVA